MGKRYAFRCRERLLILSLAPFLLVTNAYANDDDILDFLPAIVGASIKTPGSPATLVGSWYDVSGNKTLITFLDGINYFVTQDIDDVGEPLCSDGMESGTYTWDSSTGNFSLVNVIDTTGDCGLTSGQGETYAATVVVSGNTLTLTDSVEGSFSLSNTPTNEC